MTLQFNSQNVNAAELNRTFVDSPDSYGNLETLLGGAVLKEYDEQVALFSAEIQSDNALKQEIRSDKAKINAVASGTVRDDVSFVPQENDAQEIKASVITLSTKDYIELETFSKKLGLSENFNSQCGTEKGTGAKVISEKFFDLLQESLDNQLMDLNSASEIRMIQFQNLTDARKQSLMMLSNMLSSDNQTRLAVIQNMKG